MGPVVLGRHVVHVALAGIDPSRVEVIVYDLGNVLVEIDFGRIVARWADLAGIDPKALAPRFAHDLAYKSHERGEMDAAAYYASLRADLGLALDDAAMEEGWNAIFLDPIAPTVERMHRLATTVPQYLFSNTNAAHHAYWARRYERELAPLDGQFVSHLLRRRKPEIAAFEQVAREIGVPAERVLFFDDLAENVEGARAARMQSVLVRSPDDVARALQPWLGETPAPA